MNRCSPGRSVGSVARPMPVWGGHGPGRPLTLACIPVLMIEPVLDVVDGRDWFAHLLVAAIPVLFATATILAYSRQASARGTILVLTGQAVVTILAAALYGPHWYITFTMLALTLGALAPPPAAPVAILALSVVAPATVWFRDTDWTATWVTGLTVLLAGFSTYSLHRLLSVAAELDATRNELARQAVETERLRFARDLHDLLGHTLSVMVVKAQAVRKVQATDLAAATEHARDIEHIGRRALTEIREAVAGYRATGVVEELDRAALALSAADIALVVHQPPASIPRGIDALFSWVIREGITNVIRHSDAATVTVTITVDDTVARLTIADDGRGHRGDLRDGGGLEGLRERAIDIQGNLEVTDSPNGFTLTTEVPLWKETVTG